MHLEIIIMFFYATKQSFALHNIVQNYVKMNEIGLICFRLGFTLLYIYIPTFFFALSHRLMKEKCVEYACLCAGEVMEN